MKSFHVQLLSVFTVCLLIGCESLTDDPAPLSSKTGAARLDSAIRDTASRDTIRTRPPHPGPDTTRQDTLRPPRPGVDSSTCYVCTQTTRMEADTGRPFSRTDLFVVCGKTEAEIRNLEREQTYRSTYPGSADSVAFTQTRTTVCTKRR